MSKPTHKTMRRAIRLLDPAVLHTWFNYHTRVFEAFTRPETDEEALEHLPQDRAVSAEYRELRKQGWSILASMRQCFLSLEEMEKNKGKQA